jgi:copper homeostasis protein
MQISNSTQRVSAEVCVDSLASALAAQTGGAARVELCSALSEGGLTPSAGIITKARALLYISIFVMIRPRTGNFVYSKDDFEAMLGDIETAKQKGADGIVSGVLNPDYSVDIKRTTQLVQAAKPLPLTFHRAFDLTHEPFTAVKDIINCGCTRILTSGQKPSAIEGKELIRDLILQAAGQIIIMPGCGVTEQNVIPIIKATGATEFHLSGRKMIKPLQNKIVTKVVETSFHNMYETDPDTIISVLQNANSVF